MLAQYIIFAAALSVSAGASAAPLKTGRNLTASAPAAAKSRHAVLDNIISRVQMDALIKQVVSHTAAPSASTSYADAAGNTARARS